MSTGFSAYISQEQLKPHSDYVILNTTSRVHPNFLEMSHYKGGASPTFQGWKKALDIQNGSKVVAGQVKHIHYDDGAMKLTIQDYEQPSFDYKRIIPIYLIMTLTLLVTILIIASYIHSPSSRKYLMLK